ncbi:tryptophan synthase subunit alpha [Paenibacillus sp. p3-SID867]|uniref:tryptophan synthase subunit alpha n=1 Tax=Paenibacillus sp. p3-SID867 TaxID=2916363 RepID=UPI0021A52522|nr:tryptophan synthase subunit alpha [Paenibacillus sp. p3-SID867]MCT1403276.1 tryptophan synthase subunit alpha [Paenibacillus sp. p3-SID867]
MNRIDQTFASLNQQNKTALIPYLTVGDPDVKATLDIIHELEMAGADIIELGVPYSDPLADGPVIQRASERALKSKVNIRTCMETARLARERGSKLPFILFTYYNPVLQTGLDVFFEEVVRHDISGLIIPDLPVEESEEVRKRAHDAGVHLIPLVAPTSHERIASIASEATGFVYCVSSLGVTGERNDFYSGVESFLETVKQYSNVPIAIGFGISSGEQVTRFSKICDGVVVGSAIVRQIESTIPLLEKEETRQQGLLQIREFVAQLKG